MSNGAADLDLAAQEHERAARGAKRERVSLLDLVGVLPASEERINVRKTGSLFRDGRLAIDPSICATVRQRNALPCAGLLPARGG